MKLRGFVLFALLVARPAFGAGSERASTAAFAVPKDPSGQKAAASIGAILSRRLIAHPKLSAISPGRVLSGDPRTREEEMLDRARAAFSDGRKAYDALELDDAIARLGQAVTLYQQTGPLLGNTSELETAFSLLASALTLRGSKDEGISTFTELLVMNPGYQLQNAPPLVTKVFEETLERFQNLPTGAIEIYSTPPYSAVFVDGEFRGVTPVTLENLPAGTHYLRLEKDGYVTEGGPFEVSPKQRITSQTKLRSLKRGAELRDLLGRTEREIAAEGMAGNLRELSRMLVAEILVVISVSQSGKDVSLTAGVFDGPSALRIATERAVVDVESPTFMRDVTPFIDRVLAAASKDTTGGAPGGTSGKDGENDSAFGLGKTTPSDAPPAPSPSPSPSPPPPSSVKSKRAAGEPMTTDVIGIAMIGAGAIGFGVGVAFGISAVATHDDYLKTPQGSPDLLGIRRNGERMSLIADLCMVAGVVVAAAGTAMVLFIKDDEASGTVEIPSSARAGVMPLSDGALFTFGGAL